MRIVKVIPKIKLPLGANSVFDYLVPRDLESKIKIGQIVEVEFRKKKIEGMVLEMLNPKSPPTGDHQQGDKIQKPKFQTKPILKILAEKPMVDEKQIEVMRWISEYYFTPLANVVKMFVPEVPRTKTQKSPFGGSPAGRYKNTKTPEFGEFKLTVQKSRLGEIKRGIDEIIGARGDVIFLWNDLREKILVDIKLIESCLEKKRQILIILPQIADIEFLLGFLGAKFGSKLAILHSEMSKVALYTNWVRIRENRAKIILGTRSAILAPVKNPGLIIIDDEESADHKQYDMNPRYDVRRIAERLGVKLVYSSSAPRAETYYKFQVPNPKSETLRSFGSALGSGQANPKFKYQNSKYGLVKLESQINRAELVDMVNELTKGGEYSPVSSRMEDIMNETLERGKKAILFLNRKGTATMTGCGDCKFLFKCPKCELPLVYHSDALQLSCHHCGLRQDTPLSCPKCQGTNLKFLGAGTQKIEQEARRLFPDKKIVRIDKDALYYRLDINKYDIIIGTQLLLKDFRIIGNLGFLGLVSLDIMLQRPDFRASEKLYQLVSKLLIWARFNRVERVLWQTFSFENETIQLLAKQAYERFFEREIKFRKELCYPPFCELIKFIFKHTNQKKARFEAKRLVQNLRQLKLGTPVKLSSFGSKFHGVKVIGPIEPLVKKVGRNYIEIVILKLVNIEQVKKIPIDVLRGWLVDVEPESID